MKHLKTLNKNQKLIIIISFFVMAILSSILTLSLPILLIQLLFALITIPFILKKSINMAKLYLVIIFISIIFVFLVYHGNQMLYGEPYYLGGSDDINAEQEGLIAYSANIINPKKYREYNWQSSYYHGPIFVSYISLLIKTSNGLGGYSTYLPRFINIYFLVWICMMFEYLLSKYTSFSERKLAVIISGFALMPNIQYINSHVFRDTMNLLQIFLIIYLFERIITSKRLVRKILSTLCMLIIIYLTYYTRKNALAFAGIVIVLILSEHYKFKKRYMFLALIPLIFASGILERLNINYFISTYSNYVSEIAGDGLSGFIFRQPLIPIGIFLRFIYGFIIPFPNFMGLFKNPAGLLFDIIQLLIYLGVLVQILMAPFIIKRIFKFDWLSFTFLGWFGAVIISTFTFRHVILYYPFMVAMAVDGYTNTTVNNRKIVLFLTTITVILMAFLYLALKIL